jgi:hypothetical protein
MEEKQQQQQQNINGEHGYKHQHPRYLFVGIVNDNSAGNSIKMLLFQIPNQREILQFNTQENGQKNGK